MPTAVPGLVSSSSACGRRHCRSTDTRRHRSELGKSKIENLGVAALGHKNVCRFDVPVDDPFGVGRVEPVRYLDAQIKDGFHFHRTATDAVFQRRTVQILHDDEGLPVLLANLMNGADVRVI